MGYHKDSFDEWREYRRMMRLRFGHSKVWLAEKHDGINYPCDHLAKWTKVYGIELQRGWVHIFCHTVDIIPMNWYLETDVHHGTVE